MITIKGNRTFACASSLLPNRRVKWDSATSTVVYAGATDEAIGVTDGVPYNGRVAVIPITCPDGVAIEAADTIGVGVACYGAANGRVSVSNANGAVLVGTNWASGVVVNAFADVQLLNAPKWRRSFACASDLLSNRRVKWDSGTSTVVYAAATEEAIGVTDGVRVGGRVPVIPITSPFGVAIEAADTIGVGVACYGAANGRVSVSNAASAVLVGTNWGAGVVVSTLADVQLK